MTEFYQFCDTKMQEDGSKLCYRRWDSNFSELNEYLLNDINDELESVKINDVLLNQFEYHHHVDEIGGNLDGFISSIELQLDSFNSQNEKTCFDIQSIVQSSINTDDSSLDDLINNTSPTKNNKSGKDKSDKQHKTLNHTIEKSSKKQSNKEAAIRYRQKKIKEKLDLFTSRDQFKRENCELKKKIEDIQQEINFVKNILVEMLLKKA